MGTVDDLQKCIRVSNKVPKDIFDEAKEHRFFELMSDYDVDGALRRLPQSAGEKLLSPRKCARELADRFATITGNTRAVLTPFMLGLPAIKCNMFTVAEGLDLSLLVFD